MQENHGAFVTRLLDKDETTGIERWFHADTRDGGDFQIETRQDVTPLMELLQSERNLTEGRTPYGKGKCGELDLHMVARVPITILEALRKTGQHPEQDKKAFAKWLDGDGRVWKNRPKSLSR